jgi:hypothetical protein
VTCLRLFKHSTGTEKFDQDFPAKIFPAKIFPAKNISHQNISHQNISHQNISHQNISHQNSSYQNTFCKTFPAKILPAKNISRQKYFLMKKIFDLFLLVVVALNMNGSNPLLENKLVFHNKLLNLAVKIINCTNFLFILVLAIKIIADSLKIRFNGGTKFQIIGQF